MSAKACSIVALVCGIVGIVGMFLSFNIVVPIITFICAIAGIVFGAIGMKKAKEENVSKGLAVAGLVCGIVGTFFALIGVICAACVICAGSAIANSAANGDLSSALSELSSSLSSLG